jgi:hypothetical protein
VVEATLTERQFVSPVELLVGLGWLPMSHADLWRQGRVDNLVGLLQVKPKKQGIFDWI